MTKLLSRVKHPVWLEGKIIHHLGGLKSLLDAPSGSYITKTRHAAICSSVCRN